MTQLSDNASRIYRLDKFIVPNPARGEFLARVRDTHRLLKEQPGFIRDFLLEQPHTQGSFILVTLVEWQDEESIQNARAAVMAMHRKTGFDTREILARLGIEADIGNYRIVGD